MHDVCLMPNFSYTAKNWHLHICISCINICHLREVQGKLIIAWFEYRKVRFQFRSIFTLNTRCISCQKRTIRLIQGRKYRVLTRMYYIYPFVADELFVADCFVWLQDGHWTLCGRPVTKALIPTPVVVSALVTRFEWAARVTAGALGGWTDFARPQGTRGLATRICSTLGPATRLLKSCQSN